MKVLLVGPCPPPHGGISVHVYELRKRLHMAGIECRVVNADPRALESGEYICIRGGFSLFSTLFQHACMGWTLHVHINGHNRKSWLIALTAGVAGLFGPGNVLTLHSGMAPEYLASASALAGFACAFYKRIVAVSPEVRDAVLSLGPSIERVPVVPAFLPVRATKSAAPEWKRPLLATTLFFRPEYGFELLVDAVDQLRSKYPDICCLVMGSGEDQPQAEQLVAARGLRQAIVFLGNVAHEQCLSLISQADVFVRPTLVDGDASSVREALALGTRVVASDTGHRPPETVLFRAGDSADLVTKVEAVLQRPCPIATFDDGNFDTLLGIYDSLGEQDYGKTQPIARHAHR